MHIKIPAKINFSWLQISALQQLASPSWCVLITTRYKWYKWHRAYELYMSVHLTWTSKHQSSKATMLRVYESFISRSTAQIANKQTNEQAHRTQRQKDKTANTTQHIRILNDWSYYHSFFPPKCKFNSVAGKQSVRLNRKIPNSRTYRRPAWLLPVRRDGGLCRRRRCGFLRARVKVARPGPWWNDIGTVRIRKYLAARQLTVDHTPLNAAVSARQVTLSAYKW